MSILRQFTKRVLTTCVPPRLLLTRGLRHVPSERPRLALTFDDGPHPVYTGQLLDVLREAHLKATFFVVGKEAARYPELIQRMANEGHEIGNHTWSHGDPAQTSPRNFLDEVRQTDELVESLTGRIPQSMRPPKGELNWTKLSGLWRQGKTVALWNVDPRDYRMNDAGEVAVWKSRYEPTDGDVLLFHDNHPWAIVAVELMLNRGVFARYRAVTISELIRREMPGKRLETILQPTESPSSIVTYT